MRTTRPIISRQNKRGDIALSFMEQLITLALAVVGIIACFFY